MNNNKKYGTYISYVLRLKCKFATFLHRNCKRHKECVLFHGKTVRPRFVQVVRKTLGPGSWKDDKTIPRLVVNPQLNFLFLG